MSIQRPVVPMGSAVGEGWQYRIERAGHYSLWRNWTPDLAFVEDPQGGDFLLNTTYWLYGRNANLPAFSPGSLESELAAPFQINDNGQMVPVTVTGKVEDLSGSSNSSDGLSASIIGLQDARPGQVPRVITINGKNYLELGEETQGLNDTLKINPVADILPFFRNGIAARLRKVTTELNRVGIDSDGELCEIVPVIVEPEPTIVIDGQYEEVSTKVGTGTFRLADDSHNDPLQVTEGGTLPLRLEEEQSDDSWEISDAPRTWSIESGTPGATIPGGVLTIPANSISANAQLTVKATLANNSVVQAPVTVININPADSVDIDAPNAEWKGLQVIKRQILVDPQNPALFWLRYLIKSGVDVDNEVTYGSNAPYRFTATPSLALPDGYTREGGLTLVQPGKVVKNRFFNLGSDVALFEETLTVSATSALTTVYSASPLP